MNDLSINKISNCNIKILTEELLCLDVVIKNFLQTLHKKGEQPDFSRIFYVSDEEVYNLVNNFEYKNDDNKKESIFKKNKLNELSGDYCEYFNYIPIYRIKKLFSLSDYEFKILILALSLEIDRKYERIFGYLNDDLTKKYPTIGLAIELFSSSLSENFKYLRAFCPDSPLLYFNLLELIRDENTNFLSQGFRLSPHIKNFIIGFHPLSSEFFNSTKFYIPEKPLKKVFIDKEILNVIKNYILNKNNNNHLVFWIFKGTEQERLDLIYNSLYELKIPLLLCDFCVLYFENNLSNILKNLFIIALLYSSALIFTNIDILDEPTEKGKFLKNLLIKYLKEFPSITFISSSDRASENWFENRILLIPIELKKYHYLRKVEIWKNYLSEFGINNLEAEFLSSRYNFTETEIEILLKNLSFKNNIGMKQITQEANQIIDKEISCLAERVDSIYSWDDLILPLETKEKLKEICNYIKHKHLIYYHWGFEKRVSGGKGLSVLFTGSSGTGKTMAAGIIAKEIGTDLYRIDLSLIIDKYVGETEKRLKRIFDIAEKGNIILFFDEADALFGKRTEIKDSHDRYSNIEVSYLLQRIEEYDGLVILASNFRCNIDEAFIRRIHFIIEFPFPDEKMREEIWKKVFPPEAPLDKDIDFSFLSKNFKLSGGNIRNVALSSAFYAAEDKGKITMEHILKGIKRELQKMGKTFKL